MLRRGVPLQQGFAVFVHVGGQGGGVQRAGRIGGGDLDEYLVLQADVAESQFTVRTGAGEELDDVLPYRSRMPKARNSRKLPARSRYSAVLCLWKK